MASQDLQNETNFNRRFKSERRGKIMNGLLVVTIGSLFLARELGAELPIWLFTWKMLLIGIGVILAVKHRFRHPGWIILIGIGSAFLLNDLYSDMHLKPFLWPVILIIVGLIMIFKPRRKLHQWKKCRSNRHDHFHKHFKENMTEQEISSNKDFLDSTSIMAGTKKNILSKNFRGGDIVNIIGGTQLNLTQADMTQPATLEVTQVFGGTKLIIPSNWEIKSETVSIFGGIEDKRQVQPAISGESPKILILIGTTVFGGIEIKSFE